MYSNVKSKQGGGETHFNHVVNADIDSVSARGPCDIYLLATHVQNTTNATTSWSEQIINK